MKNLYEILTKQANAKEYKEFFSKLTKENEEEFIEAQSLWTLLALDKKHDNDKQKIQSFKKFWNRTHQSTKRFSVGVFVKYAAVFILAFVVGLLVQDLLSLHNKKPTYAYTSQKGGVTECKLSDGSDIWLSSNSELKISESKNKVIADLKGEALFEVIHNPQRKFIVNAGGVKVEDVGTKFDVSAYATSHFVKTTLIEGNIKLKDIHNNYLPDLKSGQVAIYDKINNKMLISNTDVEVVTAWREGKFVFMKESLGAICNELEKWYNVNIKIENKSLLTTKYTCVLKRPSTVIQVLDIMKQISNINYKIKISKYGKEEVIIR